MPPPTPSRAASRMAEVAGPCLEAAAQRLRRARHDVVVTEELDGGVESMRLELRPWLGPFEGRWRGVPAVLELKAAPGSQDLVAVSYSAASSDLPEVVHIPGVRLTGPEIDKVLIEFLDAALGRS